MDPVILQRADHLEAGPVSHMGQPGVLVTAEVALQDAAVLGAVEERTPRLQLAHPIGRLPGVELGHARVIQILASAHGVGEVDAPVVAIVDVAHGGGDPALGHDGVRLPEQRLADQRHRNAGASRFDGGAQPCPAGTDHEHVVLVRLVLRHQKILQSVQMPIEHSRT